MIYSAISITVILVFSYIYYKRKTKKAIEPIDHIMLMGSHATRSLDKKLKGD